MAAKGTATKSRNTKSNQTKTGGTAKSKSATGQQRNRSQKTDRTLEIRQKSPISADVVLWSALAISILLFISDLGFGGVVGNNIGRFFFGLFGILSYIFPFVLLAITFFLVSNQQNQIARAKVISAVLLFFFVSALIELILRGENVVTPSMAYTYGFEAKTGGGFFGGIIAFLLVKGFGLIGAYVINVIACIILLVLITERSAFRFLSNKNRHHRVKSQMRRKEKEVERMQRKEQLSAKKEQARKEAAQLKDKPRKERPARGVTFDTRVSDESAKVTDDMSEMNINIYGASEVDNVNRVELSSGSSSQSLLSVGIEDKPVSMDPPAENKPLPVEEKLVEEVKPVIMEPVVEEIPASDVFETTKTKEAETMADKKTAEPSDVEVTVSKTNHQKDYKFPPVNLLNKPVKPAGKNTKASLQETAEKLESTLINFGVKVSVTDVSCGPAVTRFELQPEMGVKVSRITNLADDIKLNLAAEDIRIEAPIPGKSAVGIEIPNKETVMVSIRELMESEEFKSTTSKIAFAAGRDISGNVIISDIAKMPHLLIAGSTGSGKSVCINTIIMSILYKAAPDEVKLIMIDPKVVELSVYNGIPHLLIPVVTDPKKAAGALHWAVKEMTDRYQLFANAGVRDMAGYNAKIKDGFMTISNGDQVAAEKMPQIVVIVDELADLMMVSSKEVEEAICRLAQLARAAGIHLIIATQRPSVNVITGLIKANMPSRIAFAVTSGVDSRTILDMNGAEKLLGKGDMLYYPQGFTKPLRVQGAFVSDKEVANVTEYIKSHYDAESLYNTDVQNQIENALPTDSAAGSAAEEGDERDSYFADAGRLIIEKEKGSIGMLQRNFKIGFNRAARIMDQLEEAGVVGPEEGTKPRRVLLTISEFDEMVSSI
ncbi:MAG: DNA translocase FtsK [Lachnospiraceae bacterium]|nr:DNA translocase FtsK [Lachnospiraceae bacterium]